MKNKKVIIIMCILMVLFLGMGFAAGRADLKINGNVKMDDMKWSIHFVDNIEVRDGSVTASTAPYITNADQTDIRFAVDLNTFGDFYEFDVDIINDGTIDAELDSVEFKGIPDELKKYAEFSADYTTLGAFGQCDALNKGESKRVHVRVAVKEQDENFTAADLPQQDSPVELEVKFKYVQKGVCPLSNNP